MSDTLTLYIVISWEDDGQTPRIYGTGQFGELAFWADNEAMDRRNELAAANPDGHYVVYPIETDETEG